MNEAIKINYYEAGFLAYAEGRGINDNEYSPDSSAWNEWRRGWNQACYEIGELE